MKLKKIAIISFGLSIIALSAYTLTTSSASTSTSPMSNILNPFIKGSEKTEIETEKTTTWRPNNATSKDYVDNIIKTKQVNDVNSNTNDKAEIEQNNASDLSKTTDKSKAINSDEQQSKDSNKQEKNNKTKINTYYTKNNTISNTTSSTSSNNTTASNPYNCTNEEYNAFVKINQFRQEKGLHTLTWSSELYRAAKIRSNEISQNFSHYRLDGSYYTSVTPIYSYENIGRGYTSGEKAFIGWRDSAPHRENLLVNDINSCAVALQTTNTDYKYYWTCLLGRE